MKEKKLKWKDVYNNTKKRKYCEITGIKQEDIEIESNSFKVLKERKYIVLIVSLIVIGLLIWTFRSDIKVLLILVGFFILADICFFVFNYFKFKATKDGLYIRFGFQQGKISYEKLKSVYISRFNEYSFLIPVSKVYSIVLRYIDDIGRIKELSFPNYFVKPEDAEKFLENFNIEETEHGRYVSFERFKILKKVGKILIFVVFAVALLVLAFTRK